MAYEIHRVGRGRYEWSVYLNSLNFTWGTARTYRSARRKAYRAWKRMKDAWEWYG